MGPGVLFRPGGPGRAVAHGRGALVFPLFVILVGVVALTVAVFALKLVAEIVSLVVRGLTP
ncbi:hypothetical protein D3C71_1726540 [compost metagenome]